MYTGRCVGPALSAEGRRIHLTDKSLPSGPRATTQISTAWSLAPRFDSGERVRPIIRVTPAHRSNNGEVNLDRLEDLREEAR